MGREGAVARRSMLELTLGGHFLTSCAHERGRYPHYVQFRLTALLSVIILTGGITGCASEHTSATDEAAETEGTTSTKALPFVGTWRWSGSGGKIGDIPLGEEDFVFRDDGTYAVLSKAGDGASECYEGTFTWSTAAPVEPSRGTIVFKGSHVRDTDNGFEREVFLDGDTLHFGEGGGTYVRTGPVVGMRCP